MKLPIYQIDAFSDKVFKGNYAAVVPLERWLPDSLMQAIATENNLSENVPVECEAEIEIDGGDRSLV
ncbi:PhzF family phenazine biosynthesis protein [Paraburkholderia sediminicola]|uniref:PhzF family phenazine biosynthesis protein n=1 Tax=Paraburkholderia sediminicola TaxID=458836 RepID=UPI0038BAF782